MPKLGLTMERGTIGAWLKAEGDDVERGEPLLEVVTDKVTMEVEAQAAGVLRRILVEAGEEVDVATPIGVIAAVDEDITHFESRPPTPTVSTPAISIPQAAATPASPRGTGNGRRPYRASPKARRIAEERAIGSRRR